MPAPIIAAAARTAATRGAAGAGARAGATRADVVRGTSTNTRPGGALPNRPVGVPRPASRPRGEVRQSNQALNTGGEESNPNIIRQKRYQTPTKSEYEGGEMGGDYSSNDTVKYRIGRLAIFTLMFLSIFLDGLELVLDVAGTFLAGVGVVLGYIKDIFTVVIIPGLFLLLKAPFWKGRKAKKKMIAMVTSFLVSLIPWVGAIMPETAISTAVTIYLTRKEDEEKQRGAAQQQMMSSKITRMKR